MVLELVPHQDAAQVGVAGEFNAVEIENFTLLELGASVNGNDRGDLVLFLAVHGAGAQHQRTFAATGRVEVIEHFEESSGIGSPLPFGRQGHGIALGGVRPIHAGDVREQIKRERVAEDFADVQQACGIH